MKKHIYALILSLFCILSTIPEYKVFGQSIHETSYIPHTSDTETPYSPDSKDIPDDAELRADTKAEKYSLPDDNDSEIQH